MNARRLLLLMLVAASSVAAADEKLHAFVAKLAKREIEAGRVIGMTIAVARGDEVIHLRGYGKADLEHGVPATEDTVYRIGSVTKMFTAAAILLLAEEGKLGLDDPITKHLPDYPKPVAERVTVRHLLSHTSGIFSFTDIPNRRLAMRRDLRPEEVIALFKDRPLHFEPGAEFRYCNSGYYLLGLILEKVSGQKYDELLEARLFEPLELENTCLDRNLRILPNRARGYAQWGDRVVNANYTSMTQPFSAGAMAATAGDLVRWQRALVNGDLLNADRFRQMTTPGELPDGKRLPYGFGCFVSGEGVQMQIRHGGGIPGFLSELAYFPATDVTVVVLTNHMAARPQAWATAIAGQVGEKAPAAVTK